MIVIVSQSKKIVVDCEAVYLDHRYESRILGAAHGESFILGDYGSPAMAKKFWLKSLTAPCTAGRQRSICRPQ
jgi:hypothetical protein